MSDPKIISREEVVHMATLSRLSVTEDEQELFARQLGDILAYMDVLSRVDTSHVEPLYSPAMHSGCLREDEGICHRKREDVLFNAPEADDSYFIVPRIV
ncbi:MAG: Asp-tRNA(Asn)/Glu-tRNA(Gln) amidotransferase subunit GatC [Desulfovibrio sp.]|nr:Asp-tRNA(Asn)/Glu-tRNA(Gln) amidotransferase subunit GatC [Desulfovibrio sp.]